MVRFRGRDRNGGRSLSAYPIRGSASPPKRILGQAPRAALSAFLLAACFGARGEGEELPLTEEVLLLTPEVGIRLAMEHNESLLMAQSEQGKSLERVREVRAEGLPQLIASVDYTRNWLLPSFVFDDRTFMAGSDNNVVGTLRLTQPLYGGGALWASLKAAHLNVVFEEEVARGVRQSVTAQIEGAFDDYLLARELERLSLHVLRRARSNLAQVALLRRTGRAAEYDLLRAQVEVSTGVSDSIDVHNDLQIAEIQLKDVIGLDLEQPVMIAAEFRETSHLDLDNLKGLLQLGTTRRPEIRQLDQLVAVGRRGIQIAKAEGRPTLDLVSGGQMQFQGDEFTLSNEEWRRSWSTGIRLEAPLFDGMRTSALAARAKLEVRRLELDRERLERSVQREVRQAWLNFNAASGRVSARRRTVEQATKGLQVAESRYRSGLGTQLEILDAQLVLARAETDFATARRDRARRLEEVELAAGVLGESPSSGG